MENQNEEGNQDKVLTGLPGGFCLYAFVFPSSALLWGTEQKVGHEEAGELGEAQDERCERGGETPAQGSSR